jgi:hypothetical protein
LTVHRSSFIVLALLAEADELIATLVTSVRTLKRRHAR